MRKPNEPLEPQEWQKPKEFIETFINLVCDTDGEFDKIYPLSKLVDDLKKVLPKNVNEKDLSFRISSSYDGDIFEFGYIDRKINLNFENDKKDYKELAQNYNEQLENYNKEMIIYDKWKETIRVAEEKAKLAQEEVRKLKSE